METITDSALLKIAHEIFEPIPAKLSPGAWKQFDEIAKKEHLNRVTMKVKFKKLHEGARLPEKATEGSAAYDLYVAEDVIIEPERQMIPLGFAIEMEPEYEALVDPRSGFSSKGIEVEEYFDPFGEGADINTVRVDGDVLRGLVDSGYRGNVGVILNIHSLGAIYNEDYCHILKKGTRIAQMQIVEVPQVELIEVEELSDTDRGEGGFGHTGVR